MSFSSVTSSIYIKWSTSRFSCVSISPTSILIYLKYFLFVLKNMKLNLVAIFSVTMIGIYLKSYIFIALIHPIQWTIALPVGATGPAKRQKKTSCIYYRQDRSQSVHSPGGASYFISCLPIDVIASFSFGAKRVCRRFSSEIRF